MDLKQGDGSHPSAGEQETAAPKGAQADSPSASTGVTAGSPPASAETSAPKSAFEAMKAASERTRLAGEAKAAGAQQATGAESQPASEAEGKDEQGAQADEAGADGKPKPVKNADTRVHELLRERSGLKPKAEAFDQLQGFVQQHGMTQADFESAMQLAAIRRAAPEKAVAMLEGMLADLRRETGHELPEDIRGDVDRGLMDEDRARELSVERARRAALERQAQERAEREAEQKQSEAIERHARAIGDAVEKYVQTWRTSDPDAEQKEALVMGQVAVRHQRGEIPRTPQEAVDQLKAARKEVEDYLRKTAGTPKSIKPLTQSGRSTRVDAPPTTAIEAVKRALQGGAHA